MRENLCPWKGCNTDIFGIYVVERQEQAQQHALFILFISHHCASWDIWFTCCFLVMRRCRQECRACLKGRYGKSVLHWGGRNNITRTREEMVQPVSHLPKVFFFPELLIQIWALIESTCVLTFILSKGYCCWITGNLHLQLNHMFLKVGHQVLMLLLCYK